MAQMMHYAEVKTGDSIKSFAMMYGKMDQRYD